MKKPELSEPELDALFDAARRDRPLPSSAFLARIAADAEAACVPVPDRPVRRALFAEIREALGGWTGLGGLATAAVSGLWIGVAPPASMPDPIAYVAGFASDAASVDAWLTGAEDDWQEFEDG